MQREDLSSQYITAQGPEGLYEVLIDFLNKAQNDSDFAAEPHYIMYSLGEQQSLIKVDASQIPFQFWYYDLLGRPATNGVKNTISKFIWEQCGEKERYLEKIHAKENE